MIPLRKINLPDRIYNFLDTADKIQIVNEGLSGAQVYKLSYHGFYNLYLKYDSSLKSYDRISDEASVLMWLQGKLKVPKILLYEERDQIEFLLTKEVRGKLMSNLSLKKMAPEIIKLYADIINQIHSIDICCCPFNRMLNAKMFQAKFRIHQEEVKPYTFDSINQGFTPEELYNYLENHKPSVQNLVFTHGDLYMNNILIDNNQLSGIIDWARGGYCDYHYDIAVILHNIEKYLGVEYKMLFLSYYKRPVNEQLIDYYWKLNEFF